MILDLLKNNAVAPLHYFLLLAFSVLLLLSILHAILPYRPILLERNLCRNAFFLSIFTLALKYFRIFSLRD